MHVESRCLDTIVSRLAEIVVRRCGEEANVEHIVRGQSNELAGSLDGRSAFLKLQIFRVLHLQISKFKLRGLNRPRNLNLEILSYEPLNFDV